jgi:hypothetical protein
MAKPGAGMPPEVLAITRGTPSTTALCEAAVASLKLAERTSDDLAKNLDVVLREMMDEGLRTLRLHQARAVKELVQLYLETANIDPEKAVLQIVKGFTSLQNQRMKRAGVNMERYMKWLLEYCGIASEVKWLTAGQSDLVVPSLKVLNRRPERAVVLEFKHTIRERWKEVRDENARSGRQVWLISLDDYVSNAVVELISAGRINLYVPLRVFQRLDKTGGHLRSIDTLIEDLRPFGDVSRLDADSLPDPPKPVMRRRRLIKEPPGVNMTGT